MIDFQHQKHISIFIYPHFNAELTNLKHIITRSYLCNCVCLQNIQELNIYCSELVIFLFNIVNFF